MRVVRAKLQALLGTRFHWLVVVAVLFVLVIVPGLAILNSILYVQHGEDQQALRDDHNQIQLLRLRVAADHKYIQAQKTAAQLAKALKKEAEQAQCRQAIAGTRVANGILLDIKGGYLDIANAATNEVVVRALRKRAARVHTFPVPKCDPGKVPVPVPTRGPPGA